MNIISNSHEHSLTIDNLDIAVMRPFGKTNAELVIAFKDQEGNLLQSIILTPEYAQALRAHLNSTTVQQIFRQGQEQHLGVETGYMKAVRITEPLGVRA